MRGAWYGGWWTYRFNTASARSARLTLRVQGAGNLVGSADGRPWKPLARLGVPPSTETSVDLKALLPATHLDLRFIAAKRAQLLLTHFTFVYNPI